MSNEELNRPGLRRYPRLTIIGLSVFCGVVICLAWHYHRHAAFVANEASGLICSLVESASAGNRSSAGLRVALFDAQLDDGRATKDLRRLLSEEPTVAWESVGPADIQSGVLKGCDVVILPGGSAPKQAAALGHEGKRALREFVRAGGGYVGICGGAFLATAQYEWGMALVNAKPLKGTIDIPGEGVVSVAARGAGIVKMELTNAGKRVLGDFPAPMGVQYTGGPILSSAGAEDLPTYVSLAVFRTEVWEYEPQRGTMIDTPAIVAGRFGKGRVIIFSPHPEMTTGLEPLVRRAIFATARSHAAQDHSTERDRVRRELGMAELRQ